MEQDASSVIEHSNDFYGTYSRKHLIRKRKVIASNACGKNPANVPFPGWRNTPDYWRITF
jgi:hypothetical protein